MAAFVVATPSPLNVAGARLSIFPGSATPAVFAADTPFWIGYAFVAGSGDRSESGVLEGGTRFELDADGEPVAVETHLKIEEGCPVWKVSFAGFGSGLSAGWHRFVGRWYDDGALILTSDTSIEFVER